MPLRMGLSLTKSQCEFVEHDAEYCGVVCMSAMYVCVALCVIMGHRRAPFFSYTEKAINKMLEDENLMKRITLQKHAMSRGGLPQTPGMPACTSDSFVWNVWETMHAARMRPLIFRKPPQDPQGSSMNTSIPRTPSHPTVG